MLSVRTVLVLFLFGLIAIVGSANGQSGCNTPSSWEELHDEQAQRSLDNADKFGRITLNCETTSLSSSSGGNNGILMIICIELFFGLLFLIGVAIGIWCCCVCRQKAMNAAAIKAYPGGVGGKEMDAKTKTVAMSAPTGKHSTGDTNV